MAGLRRLRDVNDAYESGQSWWQSWRKVPSSASVASTWVDLSGAPGNPRPNYYVGDPLTAKTFTGSHGIPSGGDVSPARKFIHKLGVGTVTATAVPASLMLCDFLLFYPLIDMDDTSEQFLDNTVTLPRYTDGVGVKAILVATTPYVGGAVFTISYTDSDGVAGRASLPVASNTAAVISTLISSSVAGGGINSGCFIPLAGPQGVRSVESVTFQSPNGGLAALVLVKPLVNVSQRAIGAYSETDFITDQGASLTEILDGAYLNFLLGVRASIAAAPIYGELHTVWN